MQFRCFALILKIFIFSRVPKEDRLSTFSYNFISISSIGKKVANIKSSKLVRQILAGTYFGVGRRFSSTYVKTNATVLCMDNGHARRAQLHAPYGVPYGVHYGRAGASLGQVTGTRGFKIHVFWNPWI